MSISAVSNASASAALLKLFSKSSPSADATQSAGQCMPSAGQSAPSAAKTTGSGGAQLASNSLSALLSLQTDGKGAEAVKGGGHHGGAKGASELAAKLIDALDTDGDGVVSEEEAAKALSQAGVSGDISKIFAGLDADSDGKLNANELTAGLEAMKPKGPPPGGQMGGPEAHPPSASDQAKSILSAFDTDGQVGLSLKELLSALQDDGTKSEETSKRFAALDANKDGVLSQDELTKGFEAQFSAATSAYAQSQALTSPSA